MLSRERQYGLFHWVINNLGLLIMTQTKIYVKMYIHVEKLHICNCLKCTVFQLFQGLNDGICLINLHCYPSSLLVCGKVMLNPSHVAVGNQHFSVCSS